MWPVVGLVWYLYRHGVIPVLVIAMEPLWHCPFDNGFCKVFFFFLKGNYAPPPPNKTSPFGQIARWTASISIQNLHHQPFCIPLWASGAEMYSLESSCSSRRAVYYWCLKYSYILLLPGIWILLEDFFIYIYHNLINGTSLLSSIWFCNGGSCLFTRITGWRNFWITSDWDFFSLCSVHSLSIIRFCTLL